MTTPTGLLLAFNIRRWDHIEYGDHQVVQALFAAAQRAKQHTSLAIGDPVVILPTALYERAATTQWDRKAPGSILARMGEVYGISCVAEGHYGIERSDDSETVAAWVDGAAALAREGLLEVGAADGPGEFFKALRAEVGRLRIDVRHHYEQTEAVKEHFARHRKGCIEAEQLLAEERLRVKAAEHALELSREQVTALASKIASTAALGVLDVLTPPPDLALDPHRVRVVMHGPDILRVLVEAATEQAVLEEVEVEVGEKFGDALGYDSLVVVQREPGEPAPGYVIRGGEADSAAEPTLRWYWRHDAEGQEDEQGPLEEAAAVDATWDQFAADASEDEAELDAEDGTL